MNNIKANIHQKTRRPFQLHVIPAVNFCLLLGCSVLFIACNKFEANPYQTKLHKDTQTELNAININRILNMATSGNDTIQILHSGDTQRFNDDLEALVKKANTLNIDFLVLAGDMTDFGTVKEFEWITSNLEELKFPYLCVIGNHDLIANGSAVYQKIFGPKNFSFTHKGYKFIFHDTNGREYGFDGTVPDLNFIKQELSDSTANYFVGVSHVPPFDQDFDKNLERPYTSTLGADKRFILSLHGHIHGKDDSHFYNDHVRYIISATVRKREANLIKIYKGEISNQPVTF